MPWIFVSFAAIFLLAISVAVKIAYNKQLNIYDNGIQTCATVSRVEIHRRDSIDASTSYVTYTAIDGQTHESPLNVSGEFPIGRKMVISYLPGHYDLVTFVSQEIEESEKLEESEG